MPRRAAPPDAGPIASCGFREGEIRLWDAARGRDLATLDAHGPDGKTLLTGSDGSWVRLWDLTDLGE